MVRIVVALWCSLSVACSGYWYTSHSSTSRQVVSSSVTAPEFRFVEAVLRPDGYYEVALDPYCARVDGVATTTVHHERFRSSTSKGLWLGLGAATAAGGAFVLTDEDMRPLGALLLTAGVIEITYAMVGVFASTRRRTRTTTGSDSVTSDGTCPDAVYDAANWAMTTSYGLKSRTLYAGNVDGYAVAIFDSAYFCETNAACRDLHSGEFVVRYLPTDTSTGFYFTDNALRARFP